MINITDLSKPDLPHDGTYEQALKIGLEILARKDPGRVAQKSGAEFVDKTIILPHLNKSIQFNLDSQTFAFKASGEEVSVWLSILALHYLNNADGRHPTGTVKHFREFKEGHFYEPAYNKKTKEVLKAVFGEDPDLFLASADKLSARRIDMGDAAVELSYFPFVPITCILWKGDEEFPAEAAVLFDETAELFFSAEDMAVAGQMAVLELVKASRS
jgi:hypothetical protein